MKTTILFAIACFCHVFLVNNAVAQRKGFMIEVGAGAGYTSYQATASFGPERISGPREGVQSIMTDFKIGYAPSDVVMLYWASSVSWFKPDNSAGPEDIVAHGVAGLGTRYFFSKSSPSVFVNATVGYSSWINPFASLDSGGTSNGDRLFGAGATVGGGYELTKGLLLQADVLVGRPGSKESDLNYSLRDRSVKLTLNYVWY